MPSVPKITPAVSANHSKMGWRSGCLLAIALVAVVAAHQYIGGSGISTLATAGWLQGLPAGSDTTASKPGSTEGTAQSAARRLQDGDTGAATGNFTSITIPLDVCGYVVPTPYEQISGEVLGTPWKDPESPPSLGFQRSLKTFIEMTSFGTLRVPNNTDQNLVLNKPVPVRGNKICITSGKNVTVNCSSVDAIADEAEEYAKNVLGIDMTKYAVKIFFLANKIPGCASASLARVGCFTNKPGPETPGLLCRTWNFEGTTKLIINLVSYNFGLLQAQLGDGTGTGPDWSSPMTPSGYHVHNAFQSHYLGWTQAITTLDSKTTKAGNWTSVRLPPRAAAATNYVLLTGYGLDLYVSYLAPVDWEKEDSNPDHIYKLLVHRQKSIKDGTRSVLLSVLGGGEQSTLLGSETYPGWVVRMLPNPTLNGTTAQICRAENPSQCAPDSGISHPPQGKRKSKPPKRVKSPKPPASKRTGR